MGKRNELSLYPIPYIKINYNSRRTMNLDEKSNIKILGKKKEQQENLLMS